MSEHLREPFVIPINVLEGVHNYCNRWCERCRFRARCTVYVNTNPDSIEARDTVPFEPVMSPEFQTTIEAAGAFEEPTSADLAAFDRRERRLRHEIAKEPALTLAKAYTTAAEVALGEIRDSRARDAAEVVRRHQYFIWIKVHRALHGKMDEWFEPDDLEADAYGSAKAALVAMDDVMAAWLELCGTHRNRWARCAKLSNCWDAARQSPGSHPPTCARVRASWIRHRTGSTGDQEIVPSMSSCLL